MRLGEGDMQRRCWGLVLLIALLPCVLGQTFSIAELQAQETPEASPVAFSTAPAQQNAQPTPGAPVQPPEPEAPFQPPQPEAPFQPPQPPVPSPFSESNDLMALRILQQGSSNFGQLQQEGVVTGWLNSQGFGSEPCQGWTGVTCNMTTNRVTALELPNFGISTRLPPELVYLTELRIMNLTGNNLLGGIPSNWGQNAVFTYLEVLDISNNANLSGALPPSWGTQGSFVSLQILKLDTTGVSGQLPLAWATQGSLPNLSYLNLSSNFLVGTIPGGWGTPNTFSALDTLDLSHNGLSGGLPDQWGSLNESTNIFTALSNLNLSSNSLTGTLPMAWGTGFTDLGSLDLHNNSLSGTLPAEWGSENHFVNISFLALANNNLSGPLPISWQSWFTNATADVMLFPGNTELCNSMNYSDWASIAGAANRGTRLSGSSCLTPTLRAGPAPQPSFAPAPQPSLAPSLAPVQGFPPTPVPAPQRAVLPLGPVPAPLFPPVPAPSQPVVLPVAPQPSPEPQPPAPVPATESQPPAPQPAAPVPVPAPEEELASPAPVPAIGSPAPAPSPDSAAQVLAQYNVTGEGLYPANSTVRQALLSAMTTALGGNRQIALQSVLPLQTSRRKLLATTDGIQATYVINSTANAAPGLVQLLNSTETSATYREQLYDHGYSVQPVLSGTSITSPGLTDQGVVPAPAPSSVPVVPSTNSGKSSLSGGAIGGIIAGVVIGILVAGGLLYYYSRRRRAAAADGKGKKSNGKALADEDLEAGSQETEKDVEGPKPPRVWWPTAWEPRVWWPLLRKGRHADEKAPAEKAAADDSLHSLNQPAQKAALKAREDVPVPPSHMETLSTLNSFEMEEDLQRVEMPIASGDLPPITEHPTPSTSDRITPNPSSDPSPGTSVSDHTAMIGEIVPDSSSPEEPLGKPLKPKRNVSFANIEAIERSGSLPRRDSARGRTSQRQRYQEDSAADHDIVAVGAYSRRHTAGETAIRQSSRTLTSEPPQPPKPNFEGHEIMGGGGGYKKAAKPNSVRAPSSSFSRRPSGPEPRMPQSRTSSGALPKVPGSSAGQPSGMGSRQNSRSMPRAMSGSSGIAAFMRLDEHITDFQRKTSSQQPLAPTWSRELGGSVPEPARGRADDAVESISEAAPATMERKPSSLAPGVGRAPVPRMLSPAAQRSSTGYIGGSSPAGFGSRSQRRTEPQARSDAPRRQRQEQAADESAERGRPVRSWRRREAELGQITLHKNFENDPRRRAEVNEVIDRAVDKLLRLNTEGQAAEAAHNGTMPTSVAERMVFCDTAIDFFNKLLPVNDEAHLPLLMRTVKMVDTMDQRRSHARPDNP